MGIGDGKSRFSFLVDERSEETCLFFIWRLDNLIQDKVLDSGRGIFGARKFGGGDRQRQEIVFTALVTGASLKNERRRERWDNTTSRLENRHEMAPEKRAIFGGF